VKKLPTDLKMLNAIYNRYYKDFTSFSKTDPSRSSKIHMPIEVEEIAADLGVDTDIIFGRLYYDLENRYGYKHDNDGSSVHFFSLAVGDDRHCVNFPYMASVLANLRDEHWKYRLATVVSFISLAIAILSIIIAVFLSNSPQ